MNDKKNQFFENHEMRDLRKNLGFSLTQMAKILGLNGSNAKFSLKQIEEDLKIPSGPVQRLAKYIQQGVLDDEIRKIIPLYVFGEDLSGAQDIKYIIRLHYPRFIATIETSPDEQGYKINDGAWLAIKVWIDDPLKDEYEYVQHAIEALFASSIFLYQLK